MTFMVAIKGLVSRLKGRAVARPWPAPRLLVRNHVSTHHRALRRAVWSVNNNLNPRTCRFAVRRAVRGSNTVLQFSHCVLLLAHCLRANVSLPQGPAMNTVNSD